MKAVRIQEKEFDLNRKTLVTLGVLAVFILSACTPTVSAPTPLSDGGMDAAATPAEEAAPAQEDTSAESPVAATEAPAEPEPTKQELLLTEIRDLLKDK